MIIYQRFLPIYNQNMNNDQRCEKCGQELKKSGPYANNMLADEKVRKGPIEIYFWCNYENCENYSKNIKVIE